MSRWYRAYVGTVSDDKIAEVALIANTSHCVAVSVWHALLESAAADQAGGSFSTTSRRVAATLRERCETVENVFAAMTELKMVADGAICAWKARQFESDSSTERSRKHREKLHFVDATLQGRCATPPETETETETEKKEGEANASLVDGEAADATRDAGNVVKIERKPSTAGKPEAVRAVGEWWNDLAAGLGLRQIDAIKSGSSRETHAWSRSREMAHEFGSLSAGLNVFGAKIRGSPFLCGRVGNFRATFDWAMNAANFQKIMEGNYEDIQENRAAN